MKKIKTSAINLAKRTDRKASIFSEFEGRNEFNLKLVPAVMHEVGSYGLWKTICRIIRQARTEKADYVLICEDDHVFTSYYSKDRLFSAIADASANDADILLGGVSWFDQVLQVTESLFWVDRFNGTQFMLVFRGFYQKMLTADFRKGDGADLKISSLTDSIFVMYPFISVQKEFGYSDVTTMNEEKGRVAALFNNRHEKLAQLDKVREFYGQLEFSKERCTHKDKF